MTQLPTAPIKLKLITTITQPDEKPEVIELWSTGTIMRKRDQVYIQYEEVLEEHKMKTTLRFGHTDAIIMRNGDIKMRLPFVLDALQRGHYEAAFGTIPLLTHTKKMTFKEAADGSNNGEFFIQYDMIIDDKIVGDYQLEFTYSEGI
ncbi:DUF1934 domain-containing protein [Kurthia sibirica]|uniref:DUF1934 domain-containing protein n=1 Tax=Kurthia sibirica TaxID=202750 RepID=A0A2U3AKQ5_9BACL|nr:DUF1934 domain-containing protein [Kurthia sibirica]PWI25137.1 DUF1934 domain-containing protein [Kurthia sibirica]GEK33218.1 hypothetical protein KSI01_07510 [Kurthia sibirica]